MTTIVPQSLSVTGYITTKKVVSTGPTSSAWIPTGYMIVNDDISVDEVANHILKNIFVAEGEKLSQQ
jgi:hypothetical protein